jgi:hypothetical protein
MVHDKSNKIKKKVKSKTKSNYKVKESYKKFLDMDRILKETKNLDKLKVTLKKDKVKGTGLYATKNIKKGETIAFYKITAVKYDTYKSPTNSIYTFTIYTAGGNPSKAFLGDIDLTSFPEPKMNIPFWGPFANEPSGDQKVNAEIDTDQKYNYRNRKKLKVGDTLIYNLTATRPIKAGEEIVWYYGEDYKRNYEVDIEAID